jgi:A118 family predicted phage portal protein
MASIKQIADQLKKMGYIIDLDWYSNIELWEKWYKGYDPDFHVYEVDNNNHKNDIEISSLHMGKTVCEDWASLLLGETTIITVEDEKSNEYLQGNPDDDMQGGVFGAERFWERANELVEQSFALGLGAFVPRIKNGVYNKVNNKLIGGTIGIDYITANHIFPLTYENKTITSCAFVSELVDGKDIKTVIQIHKKGTIHYQYYKSTKDGLELIDLGEEYAKDIIFTNKELFLPVFVKPQISNHLDTNTPFGISVFSTAIDVLKGIDLAYDNLNTDMELGRKLVFVSKELLENDADGTPIAPHKTRRRLFEHIGDGIPNVGDNPFIHEYNPSLRVAENTSAIQAQLDYLSFKCGFGQKFYRFTEGSVQTATQIISENSPLFRNRTKHNTIVLKALVDLSRNILYLAKELGEKVNPETSITATADDAIITDTNAEKMQFQAEIAAGIRQKWEYRVRFFGETEKEARKATEEKPVIDTFNFEGDEGNNENVEAGILKERTS